MKKIICLFLFGFSLTACHKEKVPALPAGATVLVLGDSLSYGTGANLNEAYPVLLAAETGWKIVNAGVPGDTSEQGLARLPELLEAYQPKLLMVELGGNDFLRNVPTAKTTSNLKEIISQAKSKDVPTLLIAIPEFSPFKAAIGSLSDHPIYKKLAKENNVLLIEDVFSDVLSENSLKSDQIHPNAQGYRKVEEKMRESLIDLGLLQAK